MLFNLYFGDRHKLRCWQQLPHKEGKDCWLPVYTWRHVCTRSHWLLSFLLTPVCFFMPLMFFSTACCVFSPGLSCSLCRAVSIDLPGAAVTLSQCCLPSLIFPSGHVLCFLRRLAFSLVANSSCGSSAALPDQLSSPAPASLLTSLSLVPSMFWWLRHWAVASPFSSEAARNGGLGERGEGRKAEPWLKALFAHRNNHFSLIF